MRDKFRQVSLLGGFPIKNTGARSKLTSLVKRFAVKFKLIPGSLKGRAYLKRIFMGKLIPLPHEITEGMADYEPPMEIPVDRISKEYKILYAIAKKTA